LYISKVNVMTSFNNTVQRVEFGQRPSGLIQRQSCEDLFGSVKKGERVGEKYERDFSIADNGDGGSCIDRIMGGGKSGAFVFQLTERGTQKKRIMKMYIDAFTPSDRVNNVRPFREVYAQCVMSGFKGYNCLDDVCTTRWKHVKDVFFKTSEAVGVDDPSVSVSNKKYYKDEGETDGRFFTKLKGEHLVLIMMTTVSEGTPLMNLDISKMSEDRLIGTTLEIMAVIDTSKNRFGRRWYAHWDLHPDNIFVDLNKRSRGDIQFNFDDWTRSIRNFFSSINLPSPDDNTMSTTVKNALKTTLHDVGGDILAVVQVGLSRRGEISKEIFNQVEAQTKKYIHGDLEDRKNQLTKYLQNKLGSTNKLVCETVNFAWQFVLSIIYRWISVVRTWITSDLRISSPKVTIIDFDLVSSRRFNELNNEQIAKLDSDILVTERTIAWLLKWVPSSVAWTWINGLKKLTSQTNTNGKCNISRVDEAHVWTYMFVFLTWWNYRRTSTEKSSYAHMNKANAVMGGLHKFKSKFGKKSLPHIIANPVEFLNHVVELSTGWSIGDMSPMMKNIQPSVVSFIGDVLNVPEIGTLSYLLHDADFSVLPRSMFNAYMSAFKHMEQKSFKKNGQYISYANHKLNISLNEKTDGDRSYMLDMYKLQLFEPFIAFISNMAVIKDLEIVKGLIKDLAIVITFPKGVEIDMKLKPGLFVQIKNQLEKGDDIKIELVHIYVDDLDNRQKQSKRQKETRSNSNAKGVIPKFSQVNRTKKPGYDYYSMSVNDPIFVPLFSVGINELISSDSFGQIRAKISIDKGATVHPDLVKTYNTFVASIELALKSTERIPEFTGGSIAKKLASYAASYVLGTGTTGYLVKFITKWLLFGKAREAFGYSWATWTKRTQMKSLCQQEKYFDDGYINFEANKIDDIPTGYFKCFNITKSVSDALDCASSLFSMSDGIKTEASTSLGIQVIYDLYQQISNGATLKIQSTSSSNDFEMILGSPYTLDLGDVIQNLPKLGPAIVSFLVYKLGSDAKVTPTNVCVLVDQEMTQPIISKLSMFLRDDTEIETKKMKKLKEKVVSSVKKTVWKIIGKSMDGYTNDFTVEVPTDVKGKFIETVFVYLFTRVYSQGFGKLLCNRDADLEKPYVKDSDCNIPLSQMLVQELANLTSTGTSYVKKVTGDKLVKEIKKRMVCDLNTSRSTIT
jgi:hypothetical protein